MSIVKGSIVFSKIRLPFLKCEIGTIGICYETYTLGNHRGGCIIFENGEHDGFGENEQKEMLHELGQEPLHWEFTNVLRLSEAYDQGTFNSYFKYGHKLLEKEVEECLTKS